MAKAVLISIQPKWCELIASGKKTVEVRKTRPKIDTPFKCYIYCTKDKHGWFDFLNKTRRDGKVIGEFVCDYIEEFKEFEYGLDALHRHIKLNACMGYDDIYKYLGLEKCGYGWHISDLVIYDKPKELSEFYKYCGDNPKCDGCEAHYYSNTECGKEDYCCSIMDGCKPLKRPPQSWCYVEEGD